MGRVHKITVPKDAILGSKDMMMKKRSYCFCCHTYDSKGNPMESTHKDELTKVVEVNKQLRERLEQKDERIESLNADLRWATETSTKKLDELKELVMMVLGRKRMYPTSTDTTEDEEVGKFAR